MAISNILRVLSLCAGLLVFYSACAHELDSFYTVDVENFCEWPVPSYLTLQASGFDGRYEFTRKNASFLKEPKFITFEKKPNGFLKQSNKVSGQKITFIKKIQEVSVYNYELTSPKLRKVAGVSTIFSIKGAIVRTDNFKRKVAIDMLNYCLSHTRH